MVSRVAVFLMLGFYFSYNAVAQNCDCKNEFAFLRTYIEKNYPGFTEKTPSYGGLDYKEYTELYETKAAKENNNNYCMVLMKDWMKYFKDNHLQISNSTTIANDNTMLSERIKNTEIIKLTPAILKKIKQGHDIEGVYYEDDSVYKVAVLKSPNSWRTYAAVVLESKNKNWTKGMVKFELKEKGDSVRVDGKWLPRYPCIFYMGNHGVYTNKNMSFSGFSLDGGIWKKEGLKESAAEQVERNKRVQERKNKQGEWTYTEFNKPDEDVAYMRISTFDGNVAYVLDSFIKNNDAAMTSTRYLVLDLRGNAGGADRSFYSLLQYIYTKPIVTPGIAYLSTNDNIEADRFRASTSNSDEVRRILQEEAREMQKNLGHYTPSTNDTFKQNWPKKNPEKIVVLVDGKCASATEQFLLATKQSSKVVTMGQITAGALDYSNKRPKPFPCIPFTLEYPISRSARLPEHPIDNVGISPDVVLSDDADWVKEAIQYLKVGKK
jgi:Peptidase family S41